MKTQGPPGMFGSADQSERKDHTTAPVTYSVGNLSLLLTLTK